MGGYSQIIAEMTLFRAASEYGTYVYYHLLSGMDLPLHNQDYIHAFFEKYEGYEFFTFTGRDIFEREKPERRIRYYYLLHDLPCGRLSGKIMTKIQDRLLIPVQRRLGVNRLRGKTFEVGYGANWVSVTDNFVRYLLSNEKKIRKIYKFSWCCDELYKHTLLLNSPFRDKVFISEGVHDRREDRQGNLRYINWWTGSPRTWRIEDQEELIEAAERGYLFSRKFDEQTDAMIIDYICDMVKHESGWKLNDQF